MPISLFAPAGPGRASAGRPGSLQASPQERHGYPGRPAPTARLVEPEPGNHAPHRDREHAHDRLYFPAPAADRRPAHHARQQQQPGPHLQHGPDLENDQGRPGTQGRSARRNQIYWNPLVGRRELDLVLPVSRRRRGALGCRRGLGQSQGPDPGQARHGHRGRRLGSGRKKPFLPGRPRQPRAGAGRAACPHRTYGPGLRRQTDQSGHLSGSAQEPLR